MSNTSRLFRFSLIWLCCILLVSFATRSLGESMNENQAKAALLYNFMKHTQWPNENKLSHFNVLFYGEETGVAQAFKTIAREVTVREKPINVSISNKLVPSQHQQMLVVAKPLSSQLADITTHLAGSHTLIISDNASDKNSVMINFVRSDKNRIAFEINTNNLVYEKLIISRDILLYGGTEIEVAAMYKKMESLLSTIRGKVHQQRAELEQSLNALSKQNQYIEKQAEQITQQQKHIDATNEALHKKNELLSTKEGQLQEVSTELSHNKQEVNRSRQQLIAQSRTMDVLEAKISENTDILQDQQERIQHQQLILKKQSEKVSQQAETITSQRNIILMALLLLLAVTIYIIIRQNQALKEKKRLYETEAALVKAQQETLDAFQSSLQLKTDFLTAINHELRTPMHGIIGELQVADRHNPISMRNSLDSIEKSAAQMMTMVDDILTYTEIQSEQLTLHPRKVNMRSLFADLHHYYRKLCEDKNLQLDWLISKTLPGVLELDKLNLIKALQKVLDNAIKFTAHGTVRLTVAYQMLEEPSQEESSQEKPGKLGRLSCIIEDSGPGIKESDKPYLFEAFRQHESGLARHYYGLGIGLAICKHILQAMHGQLNLSNRPQGGCRVALSAPVRMVSTNPDESPISETHITPLLSVNKPTVLVVEDNDVNSQILQRMLTKLGYDSTRAKNGLEALDILDAHLPSLILMDLQMPKMDGLDCTKAIRALPNESANIPIIAVTANMMTKQLANCTAAGMNGFLDKPIKLGKLNQTLQQFLASKQA